MTTPKFSLFRPEQRFYQNFEKCQLPVWDYPGELHQKVALRLPFLRLFASTQKKKKKKKTALSQNGFRGWSA